MYWKRKSKLNVVRVCIYNSNKKIFSLRIIFIIIIINHYNNNNHKPYKYKTREQTASAFHCDIRSYCLALISVHLILLIFSFQASGDVFRTLKLAEQTELLISSC